MLMTGETGCRIVIQARTQDGPCVQASYVKALNPYVENNLMIFGTSIMLTLVFYARKLCPRPENNTFSF